MEDNCTKNCGFDESWLRQVNKEFYDWKPATYTEWFKIQQGLTPEQKAKLNLQIYQNKTHIKL